MANSIAQTTTYSGSDITVIAYRDKLDLAYIEKVDQLRQEILDAEYQLSQVRDQAVREEARIFQLNQSPGFLESVGEFFTSKEDLDGKAQNRAMLIDQSASLTDFLNTSGRELQNEILRKEKEINELIAGKVTQFQLGSLHTISYSSFREKFAVRTLGRIQARGYSEGPRTISGTLVFNVLQQHELLKLGIMNNDNTKGSHPDAVMLDQIKPFNLLLVFANEYGAYSSMHLFDVTLFTEGQVMSIDEAITRNTMNFYAIEMVPMHSVGNAFDNFDQMINGEIANGAKSFAAIASNGSSYRAAARLDSKLNMDEIQKMREESRRLF